MSKSLFFAVSILCAAAVTPVLAQTSSVFALTAQQGQTITPIANNQTLGVTSTAIGLPTTFTLSGTYVGTTTAIFGAPAQVAGSTDFTVGPITPAIPLTLNPGGTFKVDVTYTPSAATASSAQLTIPFNQSSATAGGTPTPGSLTFTLSGTTGNLTVNYIVSPSNNVTPVSSGGTIPFPSTLVNATSSVTIAIVNAGTAASRINSVSLSGSSAFQLQSVGLLPAGVQSGGSFQFNILYTPTAVGNDTGTLTIQLPNGPFVVNLTGSSSSANLTYQMLNGSTVTPLTVGQPVTLPDTNVGSVTSVTIQVQNTGNAPATISNIATSGTAFALSSLPVLPATIAANSSISFTLTFSPTAPVSYTGTLTIGTTRFNLAGTGIGQLLNFSYTSGSTTSGTLLAGQTIVFPSVPLAQSTSVTVTVTNAGTLPSNITSIGIVGSGATASAYTLSNLPKLPVTLNPRDTLNFTITFAPTVSGLNSASLLVDTSGLTLSGFGTTAPTLPSYQITGASGTIQPFTQPSTGLTLAQGYPLDITGVLTLTVSSSFFASDPAVQFATGGRTIAFTIPANTTQAIFANGQNNVQFQSGTVAENVNLAATFATASGVNITPTTGSPLVLTVPSAAPTLLTVAISSVSSTSISVLVEGYSTTRSLSKLNIQFSSLSPTFNFATTSFSLDVSQSAGFWYSSSTSQTFGGEFAITYPFTLSIPTGTTLTLTNNIKVTVSATNSTGTSNTLSSQ